MKGGETMITQRYMLDFMAKTSQPSAFEVKKAETRDKGGFPQFKNVLDSAIGKTPDRPSDISKPKSFDHTSKIRDDMNSKNDAQQKQVKSFREITRKSPDTKAENVDDNKKVSDTGADAK